MFVITPRMFNPDKPVYQATLKTNKYTGMRYMIQAGCFFQPWILCQILTLISVMD
jgi:hypothetical protein